MPKSLLRLVVVLILAVAVPVQGIAAVSAGVCMALGHHSGEASAHDHAADGHGHDRAPSHHHDEGKGGEKSGAHCPPCVSCCAAAAITSFAQVFVPEQATNVSVAALPASFDGVPPDRLDRPPLAL